MFHQVHAFSEEPELFRQDVEKPDMIAVETSDYFTGKIKRNAFLPISFGKTDLTMNVHHFSKFGTMICTVDIKTDSPGLTVGAIGLFLTGQVPGVDQRFCGIYQKSIGETFGRAWRLPVPPMEIESRPLFFYTILNLDGGTVWKKASEELIQRANGIGWALMRQQGLVRIVN